MLWMTIIIIMVMTIIIKTVITMIIFRLRGNSHSCAAHFLNCKESVESGSHSLHLKKTWVLPFFFGADYYDDDGHEDGDDMIRTIKPIFCHDMI